MARTASIGIRIEPEIKKIAEKAAKNDRRTLASYVEVALVEKLEREGYIQSRAAPT